MSEIEVESIPHKLIKALEPSGYPFEPLGPEFWKDCRDLVQPVLDSYPHMKFKLTLDESSNPPQLIDNTEYMLFLGIEDGDKTYLLEMHHHLHGVSWKWITH